MAGEANVTAFGPAPGAANADIRVRFGPLDTDTMPLAWAESMLSELFTSQRKRFGDLLVKAVSNGHG